MEAARRPIKHLVRSFAAGSAHATRSAISDVGLHCVQANLPLPCRNKTRGLG